jgi:hypothetical protein
MDIKISFVRDLELDLIKIHLEGQAGIQKQKKIQSLLDG